MNVPIEYLCQQAVSVLGNVALANAFTGTCNFCYTVENTVIRTR